MNLYWKTNILNIRKSFGRKIKKDKRQKNVVFN